MEGLERSRNRRGQGALLREEILSAADRVVAASADGSAVSLRAIAREAGIAAPSIYEHFANKDEILWELLARDYADLADHIRTAVAESEPDPDGIGPALSASQAFSTYARDAPGRYRLMFETRQEPIRVEHLAEHPVQKVVAALADAVGEAPAARSGQFAARELAIALLSALHGQISLRRALSLPRELTTYPDNRDRIVRALVGSR